MPLVVQCSGGRVATVWGDAGREREARAEAEGRRSRRGVAPRGGAGLSRDGMAQAQQATALSRAGVRHGEADRGDWRLPNCIGSRAVRINQVAFTRR